jgi:hypothetical protein
MVMAASFRNLASSGLVTWGTPQDASRYARGYYQGHNKAPAHTRAIVGSALSIAGCQTVPGQSLREHSRGFIF